MKIEEAAAAIALSFCSTKSETKTNLSPAQMFILIFLKDVLQSTFVYEVDFWTFFWRNTCREYVCVVCAHSYVCSAIFCSLISRGGVDGYGKLMKTWEINCRILTAEIDSEDLTCTHRHTLKYLLQTVVISSSRFFSLVELFDFPPEPSSVLDMTLRILVVTVEIPNIFVQMAHTHARTLRNFVVVVVVYLERFVN